MGSNELRPKSRGSSKKLATSSPTDAEAKEKSKSVFISVSRSVSGDEDDRCAVGGLPVLVSNMVMCCCRWMFPVVWKRGTGGRVRGDALLALHKAVEDEGADEA